MYKYWKIFRRDEGGQVSPLKLLLIGDETGLVKEYAHLLRKNGYVLDIAVDEGMGYEMAANGSYDLIVLDRNGLPVVKKFRRQGFDTPVIVITDRGTSRDRAEGLDLGADDYLIKPFSRDELLARLRALIRRKNKGLVCKTISVAGLTMDPLKCEVTRGKDVIKLSIKEALLLELLMRNHGQVVTKERIFERVWGYYAKTEFGNVDLYIHYLRKKLKLSYIKTIRGVGYILQSETVK